MQAPRQFSNGIRREAFTLETGTIADQWYPSAPYGQTNSANLSRVKAVRGQHIPQQAQRVRNPLGALGPKVQNGAVLKGLSPEISARCPASRSDRGLRMDDPQNAAIRIESASTRLAIGGYACRRAALATALAVSLACDVSGESTRAVGAEPDMSAPLGAQSTRAAGSADRPRAQSPPSSPSHQKAGKNATLLTGPAQRQDRQRRVFAGTRWREDWILHKLLTLPPSRIAPVGNTSVVFKMTLAAPFDGAFKTATRQRPRGHLAEIAAYRLGRCLGLDNVPPAISRSMRLPTLRAILLPRFAHRWPGLRAKMVIRNGDSVSGVAIYWVPAMRSLGVDKAGEGDLLSRWLTLAADVPADRRGLAASFGTMLAFDYLTGNRDRFSGGNVKADAEASYIYLRDNDMAFPRRLPDHVHRRILQRVLRVERFSRDFFHNLRRLSREQLVRELSSDPGAALHELLNERQKRGLFDRREALLSHITSLILVHGEDRVLAFP